MTHALELIDVRGGYGRIEVLHGVTFAVPTGPKADKRLDELLASQRKQVATSGRPAS